MVLCLFTDLKPQMVIVFMDFYLEHCAHLLRTFCRVKFICDIVIIKGSIGYTP